MDQKEHIEAVNVNVLGNNAPLDKKVEEVQLSIQRRLRKAIVDGYNIGYVDLSGEYSVDCFVNAFLAEGFMVIGQRDNFEPTSTISQVLRDYTLNSVVLTKSNHSFGVVGSKTVRVGSNTCTCLSWNLWNNCYDILDDLI